MTQLTAHKEMGEYIIEYFTVSHIRTLKTHPYTCDMQNHTKFDMNCSPGLLTVTSIFSLIEKISLTHDPKYITSDDRYYSDYALDLRRYIRSVLNDEFEWLEENNIEAAGAVHSTFNHLANGSQISFNLYPIFYFKNNDDAVLFRLAH